MRLIRSSFVQVVLALSLALGLSACNEPLGELVNKILDKGANPQQLVKNTTNAERQAILSEVYGRDVIYISPAQRDAMFSDLNSFIWNVAAGSPLGANALADLIDARQQPGGPGVPDSLLPYKDQILQAAKAWPTVKDLNIGLHKPEIDARLAAIKARVGPAAYAAMRGYMYSNGSEISTEPEGVSFRGFPHDNRLLDYLWDPAQFNRLMSDDDWAVSETATALGGDGKNQSLIDYARHNLGPAFGAVTDRTGSVD